MGGEKKRKKRGGGGGGGGLWHIYMEEKYMQSFGGETSKETTFKTWA